MDLNLSALTGGNYKASELVMQPSQLDLQPYKLERLVELVPRRLR